jgi:hypothetical protein
VSISYLVQPAITWKPPLATPPKSLPKPKPCQVPGPDWADLAAEQLWEQAIVGYLKENGRTLLWRTINSVVAEALPRTRSEIRVAARDALDAMMQLIREKRVVRHRRRWVLSIELLMPPRTPA